MGLRFRDLLLIDRTILQSRVRLLGVCGDISLMRRLEGGNILLPGGQGQHDMYQTGVYTWGLGYPHDVDDVRQGVQVGKAALLA